MTDSIVTQLGRPSDDPGTRAKAIRYLTRTGNADLLAVLGLAPDPIALERAAAKAKADLTHGKVPKPGPKRAKDRRAVASRVVCPVCDRRTQSDGRCRRRDCGGAR